MTFANTCYRSASVWFVTNTEPASVKFTWSELPDPTDYTRTDDYELSYLGDGSEAPVQIFHTSVSYKKTVDTSGGIGAPQGNCGSWGEAHVDLRTP